MLSYTTIAVSIYRPLNTFLSPSKSDGKQKCAPKVYSVTDLIYHRLRFEQFLSSISVYVLVLVAFPIPSSHLYRSLHQNPANYSVRNVGSLHQCSRRIAKVELGLLHSAGRIRNLQSYWRTLASRYRCRPHGRVSTIRHCQILPQRERARWSSHGMFLILLVILNPSNSRCCSRNTDLLVPMSSSPLSSSRKVKTRRMCAVDSSKSLWKTFRPSTLICIWFIIQSQMLLRTTM